MNRANHHNKKRSWLLLRGLGRGTKHWANFPELLAKYFPDEKIELLDIRGNGDLSTSPSYLSVENNVRDLRSRSELIKTNKKPFIISISLGSMIASCWAHHHPDEISGIVLMNTSDRGSSEFFERLRPLNYPQLLRLLASQPTDVEREEGILNLTSNMATSDQKKQLAKVFAKIPVTQKINFVRQIIAASRYLFPDHHPKTEILVLTSETDRLVSSHCSKAIARRWSLSPHIHPTAGHDLPLDAPEWICDQIKNWQTEIS